MIPEMRRPSVSHPSGPCSPKPLLLEVEPAFDLVHSDGYPALPHDVGDLGAAEVGDTDAPARSFNSTDFFHI